LRSLPQRPLDPSWAALLGGYHLAFLVALGCVGAAVAAAVLTLRRRSPASATASEPLVEAEAR
jgi:hypothetical protein